MFCLMHDRLSAQYIEALGTCALAVDRLTDTSSPRFPDLLQELYQCKFACSRALLELLEHLRKHECGNGSSEECRAMESANVPSRGSI